MKQDAESPEKKPSDKKAPGFWFYTADFERDVQILSLAAQGLWTRMLCWMSDNEAHRGFLELPTGAPMEARDIGAKVGRPTKEIEKALSEMERVGMFSRDSRGCIFSRRMARDTHISAVRREAAKSRMETAARAANGKFAGDFAGTNDPPKEEQNPTVTASVSDSVSTTTHTPRAHLHMVSGQGDGIDFDVEYGKLYERHITPGFQQDGQYEYSKLISASQNPKRTVELIAKSHAEWMQFFAENPGEYRPGIGKWLKESYFTKKPARSSGRVRSDAEPPAPPRAPIKYFDPRTITDPQ